MRPFTIRDAVPDDAAAVLEYLKELAEEPEDPLKLEIYTTNTGAIRLYERLSFVHEGCRRHSIRHGGKYIDTYTMVLLLDEAPTA